MSVFKIKFVKLFLFHCSTDDDISMFIYCDCIVLVLIDRSTSNDKGPFTYYVGIRGGRGVSNADSRQEEEGGSPVIGQGDADVSRFLLFLTTDCGKNLCFYLVFVVVSKINITNSTILSNKRSQ